MKTSYINHAVSFFFFIFLLTGCKDTVTNTDTTIRGSGRVVTESRTMEPCEGVTITSIGDVYLTQSETQSVRIEADDNIMSSVISETQNGILVVGLKAGSYSNTTVRIYVSLKNIRFLSKERAMLKQSRRSHSHRCRASSMERAISRYGDKATIFPVF